MGEKRSVLKNIVDYYNSVLDDLGKMDLAEDDFQWIEIPRLSRDYFQRLYDAEQKGEPIAWINFALNPEIFWAMDIVPLIVDPTAAHTSMSYALLGGTRYIDLAEEHIPDYICGNNKILLGAVLAGELSPATAMVHPSNPCDSNLATYPVISESFGIPYFCIDTPYIKNDRTIPYVTQELKKMISFLEDTTGRKLDLDKLKQTMEYSNTIHEYLLKLNKLREAVPSPYSSLESVTECGITLCLTGTPQLADYFEKRYEMIKARVDRKEGHLPPGNEKIRLSWIYGAPVLDYSIYDWLEQEYGAVSIGQMNNEFVMGPVEDISDLDHIVEGLAKKLINLPMIRECGGPWENYLEASIELCRHYKADAAIFAGNVACKASWAVAKLAKDKIQERLGIPTLNLEIDLFDPRQTHMEKIKEQFDTFFRVFLK